MGQLLDGSPEHALFVKICGITRGEDAEAAAQAGASAIGFVFAPSPRQVSASQAGQIGAAIAPGLARIGVFVDADTATVVGVVTAAGLDGVQLQGAETPEMIQELRQALPGLFITKAVRLLDPALLAAAANFEADAILVDSKDPGHPAMPQGALPTEWLAPGSSPVGPPERPRRLIVAGGLTPGNVARAVQLIRPWGVDVSSGVERAPGVKDGALVRAFVAAARAAEVA